MQIEATLGMIAAEVEHSFDQAADALQRYEDEAATADVLEEACHAISLARGALEVADVAGAPRVLLEIEQMLGEAAHRRDPTANDDALVDARIASLCGLEAVRQYVAGLAAGTPARPMALAAALQDLLAARGSDRPAGLELFEADLARPLPAEAGAHNEASYGVANTQALHDLRLAFQKSLLEWLRGGMGSLRAIGDVIAQVRAQVPEPAPWWIAGAFIEHIDNGALPVNVHTKRVLAGLDKYIARLCAGSDGVPELLMREMLYFVAHGEAGGALVAQVRDHYGMVPEQGHGAAAASAGAQVEFQVLLQALQGLWEKAVDGDITSARSFATRIGEAVRVLPEAPAPLLETLRCAGEVQIVSSDKNDRLALEVATALLALEHAFSVADAAPGATRHFDAMNSRVQQALQDIDQDIDDASPDWPDMTGESASGTDRERGLLGVLGSELVTELATVEKRLAAYFADREDSDSIAAAEQALVQVQGALQIVGDGHAAVAVAHCIAEAGRLRDSASVDVAKAQADLATVISALTFYVERLGRGEVDLPEILRKAGAPEGVALISPTEPFELAPSVELDLNFCDDAISVDVSAQEITSDAERLADGGEWDEASDADLLPVFVQEADEVLSQLVTMLERLRVDRSDAEALSTLRRGFHTLKGSGRMVDLQHFAETCYALEKLFDRQPGRDDSANAGLLPLLEAALPRIRVWVDALRSEGRVRVDAVDLKQWIDRVDNGFPDGEAAAGESLELQFEATPTVAVGDVAVSRTLFDIFLSEAHRTTTALVAELAEIDAVVDEAHAHERFRLAHTLCGISATTGFAAIRELAGALEEVLRGAHEHGLQFGLEDRELFESVAAALLEMLNAVESLQPPTSRADLEGLLRAIAQQQEERTVSGEGEILDVTALDGIDQDGIDQDGTILDGIAQGETVQIELPLPQTTAELDAKFSETGVTEVIPVERPEDWRLERMQDDIDPMLLPAFLEEAADLIPQIGEGLRSWRADPQQSDRHQAMTRLLHTFKGAARMAGAMALGELTHSMETRIAAAEGLPIIPDSVFEGLEISFDRMGILLERISDPAQPFVGTVSPGTGATQRLAGGDTTDFATNAGDIATMAAGDTSPARQLLRVRFDLLDRLATEAGELAVSRSSVEGGVRAMRGTVREMAARIAQLRLQLRELEIQTETQIQSRQVQADEPDSSLDPLELDRFTRLQELARQIEENANDVTSLQQTIVRHMDGCDSALAVQARMTRMLQDSLVSVRLVPFASLNERLYRVVRLTARDSGRRASLDIRGSRASLDRGIVDRIAAPLEHLLRNAVAHGIESLEERRAAGKPDAGEIVLDVSQEGNELVLTLQDDGRGLDLERLRARAVDAGRIPADSTPSSEQLAQLAFEPGVSTAHEVSESAGRGVGLDVVRSEVAAVGGRIDVTFEPQRGTVFTVRLPLTMTVMQVLVVRCAGQLFALPAMMVDQVRTLKPQPLEGICRSGEVNWQGNSYPLHDLRELLAIGDELHEPRAFTPIVLVRGGAQHAAIRIEELVAHEEVVMKQIGAQLAGVTGIVGAAVRGSGEIVLILNPIRLTRKGPSAPLPPRHPDITAVNDGAAASTTVLIVDDSPTVRKITSRVLSRKGYRVLEARDGLEAIECLAVDRPELVLLDAEMPRMDGFEVLRRMRDDPRWQGLPVMMITSRTAEKHRSHAFELGASAFLNKPFEEHELLTQVADLIEKERV